MLLKNFTPFKLRADRPVTVEYLAERLAQQRFTPCTNSMLASSGFVPPVVEEGVDPSDQRYVLDVPGGDGERYALVVLRTETRLLPASVVKKAFMERLDELERAMGGKKIKGRAKKEVKEEVIRSLIPKAFTRQVDIRAVFALKSGWLFVDSSSWGKTDAFVSRLVGALDMAPMRMPMPKLSLASAMSHWLLSGEAPAGFSVDRECELKGSNAATIRYIHLDLDNEEVRRHVRDGKAPQQVALTYDDRLSFVITQKMVFKKIGLNTSSAASADNANASALDADTGEPVPMNADMGEEAIALSADILIGCSAYIRGLTALMASLGGEDPDADKNASAAEADAAARAQDADKLAESFNGAQASSSDTEEDPLYEKAVALVIEEGRASISFVQRHFMMGYNRAARLVERMEKEGIVSPMNKDGGRKVL